VRASLLVALVVSWLHPATTEAAQRKLTEEPPAATIPPDPRFLHENAALERLLRERAALLQTLKDAPASQTPAARRDRGSRRKGAKPPAPPLPGEKITFETSDGWTLTGTFSPPKGHLTFLFLHGVGSNRGEWGALAQRLAAEGFGILAYDARGHAESQAFQGQKVSWRTFSSTGTDNEWNRMTLDVEAALSFLASWGIQSSSVAFCGASVGANILLKAAARRKEIPMLVLLSPGINYRDVLTVNAIRLYGRRPILLVASGQDRYAHQSAQLLYNLALPISGSEEALYLEAPEHHGAPMLDNPVMMDAVVGWIRSQEKGEAFTLVAPSTGPVTPSTAVFTTPSPLPAPSQ